MAKPSKRTPHQEKKTTQKASSPSSSSSSNNNNTQTTNPPVPFAPSPSNLHPFLSTLDKSHFYITNIDSHPPTFKRQVFLVPILLNILITALALYRVYDGLHTYPAIISSTFTGGPGPDGINTSTSTWPELTWLVLRRFFKFLIDYLILTLLLPWPVRLVLGPIRWRRALGGYRDHEIIVRKSRSKWSQGLLDEGNNRWIKGVGSNAEEVINFARDRVMPAMAPERVAKTGYLLVDADWDLDFEAMRGAHELVDNAAAAAADASKEEQSTLGLVDFRTALHIHESGPRGRGWLTWRIDPDLSNPSSNPSTSTSTFTPDPPTPLEEEEAARRDAQRNKIVAFKDKLTAMGRENLFFRWVELIQYESTRPGGFTAERQASAMRQAREMFEEQGVDFGEFWREVGGMEGLPGFEDGG